MLITGGSGLVGSTFKNVENSILHNRNKCDLIDPEKTFKYLSEQRKQTDTLIHCAAKVGGLGANMTNNELFFRENKIINDNILEFSKYLDYKNVVTLLSTCIFPNDKVNYPLTADQMNNGKPHSSNYGYSYAKRLLGYQTEMYKNMTNNNWFSIIPTNLYGYNDNFSITNGHIIPALIHKAYLARTNGTSFEIWGDGSAERQFMMADDLKDVILWSLDNWNGEKPLMAINEKEYKISDVVNIIADRFEILDKIKYNKNKPNGQLRKPAKSDLPNDWEFTKLEYGINLVINDFLYKIKGDNVRK